ncbi:ABC transporter permease [Streptomyces paludis]|uniref:ABC transporter permease n=1 Tax=Streptomyces paludis TaxID=2282738 RepID=A0A345HS93_9ACTN|nr:ABC transporter permease [Streptomyces paludis]AXG79567.1 ABC transporter permease [Streptomyces paludis]
MSTDTRQGGQNQQPTGTKGPTRNTGPTGTVPTAVQRGPARLAGMLWLVWRQHRAAFLTLIAVTAVAVGLMAYLRADLMGFLASENTSAPTPDQTDSFESHAQRMWSVGEYLGYLPLLIGVFIGAPLFAGDLETGTARLVTAQSVSRTRWIVTKLALTGVVVAALTALLSAVFGWWWRPVSHRDTMSFTSGTFFDNTGIVPVALALLAFSVGAAAGLVLRRTLVSMVATLGIVAALQVVWSRFRLDLGTILTAESRGTAGQELPDPKLPSGAVETGEGTGFLTGSGERLDWMTCLSETEDTARTACLQAKDIVGLWKDYLPISQMPTMQYLGAAIILTLTAALTTCILLRGRKQPL